MMELARDTVVLGPIWTDLVHNIKLTFSPSVSGMSPMLGKVSDGLGKVPDGLG